MVAASARGAATSDASASASVQCRSRDFRVTHCLPSVGMIVCGVVTDTRDVRRCCRVLELGRARSLRRVIAGDSFAEDSFVRDTLAEDPPAKAGLAGGGTCVTEVSTPIGIGWGRWTIEMGWSSLEFRSP